MGVVAVFFKLSMSVRDLHNHLVENVGIPAWASYSLFAIVTLALGCVLGFVSRPRCIRLHPLVFQIIVCVIDYVFPTGNIAPKKTDQKKAAKDAKANKTNGTPEKAEAGTAESFKLRSVLVTHIALN